MRDEFHCCYIFCVGCPYVALTQGHISDRLEKTQDKLLLLDYLTKELMAARILREKRPEKKIELKIVSHAKETQIRDLLFYYLHSKRVGKLRI